MKALSNDLSRALSRPTWAEQIEALERAVASDRDLDAIREVIEGWWSGEGSAEPVGRRPEERLRLAHGTVLAKLGRWGEAAEMLDPLMDPPSAALAPAALAGAYNLRGIVHRHQGHQEQAQVCFREAERLWERTGDAAGLARAYINQANLHGDRGDYGSAVNLHERALEHVSPEREPNLFARLLLNTAFDHHQLGNHEVSVELLERASAMIEGQEHGTRLAGECAVLLGYVRLSQEAATEAAAHFEEGRRRAVELGNRAILASALTGMGEALAQSGDATRALPFLAEARSILEAIGDQRDLAKLEVAYGEVLHAAGDQAGARASFERGQAMAEATGYIELFERVHRGLAAVAEAEGDAAEALAHLRRALECVRETFAERTRNQLSFLRLRLDSLQERHLQELDEARRTRLEEDNAQLSAANRRLEQLVFERRELLSIVAHDLRSPLASVVTVSEVAETSSDLSAEDLQRFLRELALSSESSLELLDLLLNLERMDASMVSARAAPVDIATLLDSEIIRILRLAQHKDIQVAAATAAEGLSVEADAVFLSQILHNFLSNAVKYSPHGSRIQIFARALEDMRVEIAVVDEGPGIPPEKREGLFNRFYQAGSVPTGGESSVGLGLYLVRRYADLLGGQVGYRAREPHGSIFWVRLPPRFVGREE